MGDGMKSRNILVVDDEKAICNLVEFRLKLDEFNVTKAFSAEEGLHLLEEGFHPDVILLDLAMPGMSGLEFCKRVKSNNDYKETKVVIVTALSDESHRKKGEEAGADRIVFKPFRGADLIKVIEELAV